jgi:hypothetical protein
MNQGTQSEKMTRRKEKQDTEEAKRAVKEQERKQDYLAKERAREKVSDSKQTQRVEKRALEEAEQLSRKLARKKDYDAREKDLVDAHEARKLRDKE